MTLFPDELGDLVFDVGFHQIRGQCTEHPDATGMKQQEKPRGMGRLVTPPPLQILHPLIASSTASLSGS